jgi:carboxylesterase
VKQKIPPQKTLFFATAQAVAGFGRQAVPLAEEITPGSPKSSGMKALVLHGFTGSLDTVSILKPALEAQGLEVSMPILRGHSAEPEHLNSVHWRDWVADGRAALRRLAPNDDDRVVIAGLSMGALIGCQLAAEFPHQVHRLALLAPAFAFRSKLLHALPVIKRVRRDWPASPDYADPSLAAANTNYLSFPIEALESVLHYIPVVESLLPHIQCPVGVFFAKKDPAIAPSVPKRIEALLGRDKVTHFVYEQSHHEILQDIEAEKVAADVVNFLCAAGPPSRS